MSQSVWEKSVSKNSSQSLYIIQGGNKGNLKPFSN